MGRLGVLIVLLAIVIAAAVVVQLRVAPEVALSPLAKEAVVPENLSKRDQARLKVLQDKFVKERDAFLKARAAGVPEEKLKGQQAKATAAAQAVTELGGQNALKSVGKSQYAPTSSTKPGDKGGDPSSTAEGASCSGESCSDGGTCTPSSAGNAPSKDAKAGEPAKADAAAKLTSGAKPAAPVKPATK